MLPKTGGRLHETALIIKRSLACLGNCSCITLILAGVVPWTLTPVNQQLDPVEGSIDVQPAPQLPEHVGAHYARAISDAIGERLMRGLGDYQNARRRTFADPASCAETRTQLGSDLGHSTENAELQIMGLGQIALLQAIQANASQTEMAEIVRITADGVQVLSEMMNHLKNTVGDQNQLMTWCENGNLLFKDGFETMAQLYNAALINFNTD